jgi:hypothetical protein
MSSNARRKNVLGMLFVAMSALGVGPGRAQAQFGFGGGGFGFGFGFNNVPQPGTFINSKALIDAGRNTHIPSRDVYANNPNSYINHIRDNGFVEHYDVYRHDPAYNRYLPPTSPPAGPRTTPTAMTVPQPMPSLPLASFYNADGQIVWPADAPSAGDLKDKRSAFDQASQAVLTEAKKTGVASIATVTDARQKLLEYGRPGLQYVRTHETARVADTYHLFLLSLYESLAQAINPTMPAPATRAPSS